MAVYIRNMSNNSETVVQIVPAPAARGVSLVAWFFGITWQGLKAKCPEMAFTDGYDEEERGYDGREIRFTATNPRTREVSEFVLYHRYSNMADMHVSSLCCDNAFLREVGAALGATSVMCYYSDATE